MFYVSWFACMQKNTTGKTRWGPKAGFILSIQYKIQLNLKFSQNLSNVALSPLSAIFFLFIHFEKMQEFNRKSLLLRI